MEDLDYGQTTSCPKHQIEMLDVCPACELEPEQLKTWLEKEIRHNDGFVVSIDDEIGRLNKEYSPYYYGLPEIVDNVLERAYYIGVVSALQRVFVRLEDFGRYVECNCS